MYRRIFGKFNRTDFKICLHGVFFRVEFDGDVPLCVALQRTEFVDFSFVLKIFSWFSQFSLFGIFKAAKHRMDLKLSQPADLELPNISSQRWRSQTMNETACGPNISKTFRARARERQVNFARGCRCLRKCQ